MWFRGQKVVCIDDTDFPISKMHGFATPVKDVVYHIREIVDYPHLNCVGFSFVEIRNPAVRWRDGLREITFHQSKFRPVIEKKTDITIFTEMLKPVDALRKRISVSMEVK